MVKINLSQAQTAEKNVPLWLVFQLENCRKNLNR